MKPYNNKIYMSSGLSSERSWEGMATPLFRSVGAVSLVAAVVLAAVTFFYIPFGSDATWYAYPGYAWSVGGDPSENMPGFALPAPLPDRPVAQFAWENRSMLGVLFTRLWFDVAPESWVTLKVFGALQYLLLVCLVGLVVRTATRSRAAAVFAAVLTATDARAIEQGFTDARPDLFIAVIGMGLLLALLNALRTGGKLPIVVAMVLAVALPLVHVTAAMSVGYMVVFLVCQAVLGRRGPEAARLTVVAAFFSVLMVAAFFLKQPVLDVLIPTSAPVELEMAGRHSIVTELQGIIDAGAWKKVSIELKRWHDYFLFANAGHLLFILGSCGIAAFALRKAGVLRDWAAAADDSWISCVALLAALITASGVMLVFDSHTMRQHLLPIAVLAYAAGTVAITCALRAVVVRRNLAIGFCAGVLAMSGLLNAAHAYSIYQQYGALGLSNPSARAAVLDVLPDAGMVTVIGPSEIWPYLAERHEQLLLLDQREIYRANDWNFAIDAIPGSAAATVIVINKGLIDVDGWGRATAQWTAQGLIEKTSQVGDCDRGMECYVVYRRIAGARPAGSVQ